MKVALLAAENELARYAYSLSRIQGLEWVGYCLTSGEGTLPREETAGGEKLPRLYASPYQLASEADMVVVGGCPEERFDYISALLRQGKPVWSDWPLSTAGAKARKLAALAEEAHVCTHVAHYGRRHPVWSAALPYLKQTRMIRTEISCPGVSCLEQALERELFPYIDRVLSLDRTGLSQLRARKVQTSDAEKFSAQMELEFFSGMLAECWLSNISTCDTGKMRCINAESVVDLDFVNFGVECQETGTLGKREKIRLKREHEPMEKNFLTEDLRLFTNACLNGQQESLDFAESGRVQEILFRIRRILL